MQLYAGFHRQSHKCYDDQKLQHFLPFVFIYFCLTAFEGLLTHMHKSNICIASLIVYVRWIYFNKVLLINTVQVWWSTVHECMFVYAYCIKLIALKIKNWWSYQIATDNTVQTFYKMILQDNVLKYCFAFVIQSKLKTKSWQPYNVRLWQSRG